MKSKISWWTISGLLLAIPVALYINVWVIHWAVNLFTPISMWQAFGISVLLNMIGSILKGVGNG